MKFFRLGDFELFCDPYYLSDVTGSWVSEFFATTVNFEFLTRHIVGHATFCTIFFFLARTRKSNTVTHSTMTRKNKKKKHSRLILNLSKLVNIFEILF